jgi:hypothetical protein
MNSNVVNYKTIGGVVVGVAVGHFVIKSRSVLFLTAMGLAGGLVAHYLTKSKTSASGKAPASSPSASAKMTFIKKVEDSISDELDVNNEDVENEEMESFYGTNREMQFDESLGYKSPYNTQLEFERPADFMDINFNE